RRQVLAGAAGAALLTRCGKPDRPPGPKPIVSIVRAASYQEELGEKIVRIVADHKIAVREKHVVLKPNLVEFDPSTTINTHPAFVLAVYEAFRSLGAASVHIAEGPGHRRATLDMAEAAGYFAAIPDFEDRFTDLN